MGRPLLQAYTQKTGVSGAKDRCSPVDSGHYFKTLERSHRAPFIVRWPDDRYIDGVNQIALLKGETGNSAREAFPAYKGENLQSYC